MADELTPLTATRSSLLKPLKERSVLVPNERVYYAERRHWASVAQPVYETFVFLLFVIWTVGRFGGAGTPPAFRWIQLLLAAALGHIIWLFVTGRRPTSRLAADPFSNSNDNGVGRFTLATGALVTGLVGWLYGPRVVGALAVFAVITRLVVILARWTFYERRYITNRRLIEAGGLLGSRISSMPLSRVTDISYMQTIPGELLHYSSMRVETAGQDQALGIVHFIANPDHFYEVLISFSAPATSSSAAPPPPE
jgi:hypothetical protein